MHEQVIHKEKGMFKCAICDAEFAFRTERTKHRKAEHNNKSHACSICNSLFLNKSHLRKHLKVMHLKENLTSIEGFKEILK